MGSVMVSVLKLVWIWLMLSDEERDTATKRVRLLALSVCGNNALGQKKRKKRALGMCDIVQGRKQQSDIWSLILVLDIACPHNDLHHYVPQNQLIDLFFPPKRYGSTQWRSSRDRTLPGEFSPSSMSELAGGCSERSSDPLSRMRVVCFQSFHIRDKSGIGTPFFFS